MVVQGKWTPRAPVSALRQYLFGIEVRRSGPHRRCVAGGDEPAGSTGRRRPVGCADREQGTLAACSVLGRLAAVAAIARMRVPHHPPGLKATPDGDCVRAAARTGALTPCGLARRPHPPSAWLLGPSRKRRPRIGKGPHGPAWHPTDRARQWRRCREGKAGPRPWPSDASTPGLDVGVGPGAAQFARVGLCAKTGVGVDAGSGCGLPAGPRQPFSRAGLSVHRRHASRAEGGARVAGRAQGGVKAAKHRAPARPALTPPGPVWHPRMRGRRGGCCEFPKNTARASVPCPRSGRAADRPAPAIDRPRRPAPTRTACRPRAGSSPRKRRRPGWAAVRNP